MPHNQIKEALYPHLQNLKTIAIDCPWSDRAFYSNWLAHTYHYAENSTRILALAAGHMPMNLTDISQRFIAHAQEERGHELLLQKDLKSFGYQPHDLPLLPQMNAYMWSLYYWFSPNAQTVGILGWILSLEGLAAVAGPTVSEQAISAFGKPGTHFLRVHSDADPDHFDKALAAVATLNESDRQIVLHSAKVYFKLYAEILEGLKLRSAGKLAA